MNEKTRILISVVAAIAIYELFTLFYWTENPLTFYLNHFQMPFFALAFFFSFYFLFSEGFKKNYAKAGLLFLLPWLIYGFINYNAEALFYGYRLHKIKGDIPTGIFVQMNQNLSLCDIKIGLVTIGLLVWLFIWLRFKNRLWKARKNS